MSPSVRGGESGRGQTTQDFVIGISVFLLVVVFVLAFVPGIFDPFEETNRTQTVDRYGATLASDVLGDPSTPATLNATCTWHFFRQMQTGTDTTAACRFDDGTDTVAATLGSDRLDVNVTVVDDGAVVSLNAPDGVGGSARELRAGPPVPSRGSVVTTRRVVLLEGQTRQLVVRAW
ncbi:DUF7287 family protein [Halogeometricum limi]|uniref:Uncharacterized protein n=1 Tax=Halogeometricum limi TaxID=555875 RepID=A0A1I6GQN5_9EURY|nr:hypothetical protein [Halogeometricum limi]SFR44401.1 hypothetical protein SAMN04488124_1394 [Halogeometricum limi]